MYMMMSRSGSADSRQMSCAMTSLADASSIWTPRKMIRSSNILLYGLDSLIPYEVRSTNDGMMYRFWMSSMRSAVCRGRLRSLIAYSSVAGASTGRNLDGAGDHLVDEAVVARLFGGEPAVAVGVGFDLGFFFSCVGRHPHLHSFPARRHPAREG